MKDFLDKTEQLLCHMRNQVNKIPISKQMKHQFLRFSNSEMASFISCLQKYTQFL